MEKIMVSHENILTDINLVEGNPYQTICDLRTEKLWLEYEIDMLNFELDFYKEFRDINNFVQTARRK